MKTCFKCQRLLSISDFYTHSKMADGHLNKCIECTKKATEERREAKKMTDLDWVLKERERHRLKSRLARENSKASKPNIKHQSKWIKKNPLKRATHHIVAAALKSNRLTKKPCEVCGSKRSQAHHEDYLQPLEVTWLCSKHHAARHIALREETIRQSFGF